MTNRTGILLRSPLTHAIASVRFAPWANLPNKMAQIQDDLREIAPLLNTVQIDQGIPGQVPGIPNVTHAWMLMASDKSYGIQLAADQLLLFTTRYTRFSDFIGLYRKALSVLLEHMRFVDVVNMGVRYVDRIVAQPHENVSDYISDAWLPPVLPEHERSGGTVFGEYRKGETRLRVSAQTLPNVLPVPNDVFGLTLMTQSHPGAVHFTATTDKDLILDMDSIRDFSPPARMKLETVVENLDELHKIANDFFRNSGALTDHAFKIWQGEL